MNKVADFFVQLLRNSAALLNQLFGHACPKFDAPWAVRTAGSHLLADVTAASRKCWVQRFNCIKRCYCVICVVE
jgi:hypothetical protein